ncbi:chitin binding peritrophin-A domain-containing protein [Pseudomonas sp. SIMBA_059]
MSRTLFTSPVRHTSTLLLAIGAAVMLSACTTPPAEQWTYPSSSSINNTIAPDPPCTKEGYFASSTPTYYYRCRWVHPSWYKYIFQCPGNKNFNEVTQRCE